MLDLRTDARLDRNASELDIPNTFPSPEMLTFRLFRTHVRFYRIMPVGITDVTVHDLPDTEMNDLSK